MGWDLFNPKRQRLGPDDFDTGCIFWILILAIILIWVAYEYFLGG